MKRMKKLKYTGKKIYRKRMIGRTWNDSKKLKHTAEERERKKWRYHSRLFVRQDDSRHNMCAAPATYGSHCISNHPLYYADNAIWHVYVACDRGTNCLMCSSAWWNFESRKGEELSLNLVCDRAFGSPFRRTYIRGESYVKKLVPVIRKLLNKLPFTSMT